MLPPVVLPQSAVTTMRETSSCEETHAGLVLAMAEKPCTATS